ncbi:uncharacterized protein C2845_PM07G19740 [Panicum miliaceum]|uniref:Core-2/I-branching beta-1,6-N-acetylglucosaminyltransferase family protein n=1 Tax=Panicum miliaceum TaxID=4540 RepID=A0A3L6SKP7_PANMI|nr:uncharacterized protein C2845_PM07G19740 [Panicum miliaceum]
MPVKRSASVAALPPAGRRARARLCLRLAAPLSFLLLLGALLRAQPLLGVLPPAAPPPAAGPAKSGEEGRFSVYVHSAPGFQLDRTTTGSPYFYGRQLARSVKVVWGEATMVEAERLLFAAALQDPANQRFALLSDSCVPLYNFSYIYTYLMASPKSFVDSFVDKTEKRYNQNMSPAIPKDKWRKGSQMVVTQRLLGRRPNPKGAALQEHDCIPDEHYVQTLFSIKGLEGELERRTLTYTSWNQSSNPKDKMTWHPMKFEYDSSSPEHISAIKSIDHVNYQMEYRTEWCQCNCTSVPCFLFARKFSYSAAMHLLEQGAIGPPKSAQLLVNF